MSAGAHEFNPKKSWCAAFWLADDEFRTMLRCSGEVFRDVTVVNFEEEGAPGEEQIGGCVWDLTTTSGRISVLVGWGKPREMWFVTMWADPDDQTVGVAETIGERLMQLGAQPVRQSMPRRRGSSGDSGAEKRG